MSTTAEKPAGKGAGRPPATTPADLLPLLTAAVRASLTLLVPIVVLTLVAWLGAVRSTSSLAAVVRVGTDLWLLGHAVPVDVVGGTVSVTLLGMTLLAVASGVRAVRMWVRDQLLAERGVPFGRGTAVFAGAYGVIALLVALVSRSGVTAGGPLQALGGGLAVGAVAAVVAMWGHRPALPARVPAPVAAGLRPGGVAAAGLLAAGALLVAVALVHGRSDVLLLHSALDPGLLGGLLLTLGQALLVPTFAVWGAAWIAGPGFAVGTGTSVAPGGTSLATLPTIPVFGALPAQGPTPVLAWAVVLVPVLLGALAVALEARRPGWPVGLLRRCASALVAGALAGAVVGVLAALSSGSAGPGRMGELGPHAAVVALVVAGEVAAGGLIAVLLTRAVVAVRGRSLVVRLPDTGLGAGGGGVLSTPKPPATEPGAPPVRD